MQLLIRIRFAQISSCQNKDMDATMEKLLHEIIARGTSTYGAVAQEILNAPESWATDEIRRFLDSYLNDPYLTRN